MFCGGARALLAPLASAPADDTRKALQSCTVYNNMDVKKKKKRRRKQREKLKVQNHFCIMW
jgi:hypothetical protein